MNEQKTGQQPHHIFPESVMQQFPGSSSEDAPAVALSKEMASIAQQTIERALEYYRIHGIQERAFRDLLTLVAGSLMKAGLSEEDWKQMTAYGAHWFQAHPKNWAATIHPETGQVWLDVLKVPPLSLLKYLYSRSNQCRFFALFSLEEKCTIYFCTRCRMKGKMSPLSKLLNWRSVRQLYGSKKYRKRFLF